MTPDELREALAELGWSQAKFARLIGTHPNAVCNWATGKARVPGSAVAYLRVVLNIRDMWKGMQGG